MYNDIVYLFFQRYGEIEGRTGGKTRDAVVFNFSLYQLHFLFKQSNDIRLPASELTLDGIYHMGRSVCIIGGLDSEKYHNIFVNHFSF